MDTNRNIAQSGRGRILVYPNNNKTLSTDLRVFAVTATYSSKPLTTNNKKNKPLRLNNLYFLVCVAIYSILTYATIG